VKKTHKLGLFSITAVLGALVLSGCTANFCSVKEKSRIMFAIEPGVSVYYNSYEEANAAIKEGKDGHYYNYVINAVPNTSVYQLVETLDGAYTKSSQLNTIISTAEKSSILIPSANYFAVLDQKVVNIAFQRAEFELGTPIPTEERNVEKVNSVLTEFGYLKYFGSTTTDGETEDALWSNYDEINKEIIAEYEKEFGKGYEFAAYNDFFSSYKTTLETATNNLRACITTTTDKYGSYGTENISVTMESKNWGYAWKQGGALIEGLIVYPVSALVDVFVNAFSGHNSAKLSSGVPQILALLFVTIIVRLFIFALSFKSTLTQQKMTALQPEIAKIQAKYPNSNTNQAQKQALSQEQMKLYKKHKVNPLSSLLILVIQFPVFIGVWGAMTGNAALSTGQFLGLNLSTSVWEALTSVYKAGSGGWWTALVLFILMAVSQFLAMKIPQWIQKSKQKKIARLGKNPAMNQQNKTMNIVSWVMLIMIIVMGFTLPAAMGFYWFIGALISLAQSLLMNYIGEKKYVRK